MSNGLTIELSLSDERARKKINEFVSYAEKRVGKLETKVHARTSKAAAGAGGGGGGSARKGGVLSSIEEQERRSLRKLDQLYQDYGDKAVAHIRGAELKIADLRTSYKSRTAAETKARMREEVEDVRRAMQKKTRLLREDEKRERDRQRRRIQANKKHNREQERLIREHDQKVRIIEKAAGQMRIEDIRRGGVQHKAEKARLYADLRAIAARGESMTTAQVRQAVRERIAEYRREVGEAKNNALMRTKGNSRMNSFIFQGQQIVEDINSQELQYAFRNAGNNVAYMASMWGGPAGVAVMVGLTVAAAGQLAYKIWNAADGARAFKEQAAEAIRLDNQRRDIRWQTGDSVRFKNVIGKDNRDEAEDDVAQKRTEIHINKERVNGLKEEIKVMERLRVLDKRISRRWWAGDSKRHSPEHRSPELQRDMAEFARLKKELSPENRKLYDRDGWFSVTSSESRKATDEAKKGLQEKLEGQEKLQQTAMQELIILKQKLKATKKLSDEVDKAQKLEDSRISESVNRLSVTAEGVTKVSKAYSEMIQTAQKAKDEKADQIYDTAESLVKNHMRVAQEYDERARETAGTIRPGGDNADKMAKIEWFKQIAEDNRQRALQIMQDANAALQKEEQLLHQTTNAATVKLTKIGHILATRKMVSAEIERQIRLQRQQVAEAERLIETLQRQRRESSQQFGGTMFGFKRNALQDLTERRIEELQAEDKKKVLGYNFVRGRVADPRVIQKRAEEIERRIRAQSQKLEVGMINSRIQALSGQANAAGSAGNFEEQRRILQQKQQLQLQVGSQMGKTFEERLKVVQMAERAAGNTQKQIEASYARQIAQQRQKKANAQQNIQLLEKAKALMEHIEQTANNTQFITQSNMQSVDAMNARLTNMIQQLTKAALLSQQIQLPGGAVNGNNAVPRAPGAPGIPVTGGGGGNPLINSVNMTVAGMTPQRLMGMFGAMAKGQEIRYG